MSEKFDDNRCGCETKECFPKKCLCKIKCSDGDADDFTEKVTDHQKAKELHSRLQQPSVNDCKQAMMMTSTQAVKAFKTNTVRTLKAGCAWDELMKKQLTFNCLLKYPDPEIGNY